VANSAHSEELDVAAAAAGAIVVVSSILKAVEATFIVKFMSSSLHRGPSTRCCVSRLKCQLEIPKMIFEVCRTPLLSFLVEDEITTSSENGDRLFRA
jgi:hypothetical protein